MKNIPKIRCNIASLLLMGALFLVISFILFSCDEDGESQMIDTTIGQSNPLISTENISTNVAVISTVNEETTVSTSEINTTPPVEAHIHSFGDWLTVKDSDCVKQGIAQRVCECGDKEEKIIDVRPHSIVIDEAVSPTCEVSGLTEGSHCEDCFTIIIDQEEISALGHNEIVDIAIPPTCNKNGLSEGKHCATCFKVIVVQKIIPATDHNPGDWIVGLPATVSVNGLKYQLCTDCNATVKEEIILATGSLGLEYKQLFPGIKVCIVKGMGACTDTDLHIGTLVDDNRVSDISNGAFKNNTDLKSLTIHGPITSLGSEAFSGCTNIAEVTFMDDIDNIGNGIFSDCSSLKSFVCKKSIEILGVNMFLNCTSLSSVQLSDDLSVLATSSFEGCSSLSKISLPNTLTVIGENAFKDCVSLNEIYYNGTKEQWLNVNKATNWKINCGNVTIICSDGIIG